jgi:hypothetical protein
MMALFERPLLFLCAILLIPTAWGETEVRDYGQEYDAVLDTHSEKYIGGSHLIYDCSAKHWVCVVPYLYKECGETHAEAMEAKKIVLGCVPGKIFESKLECRRDMLRLIGLGNVPRSCLHPIHRGRLIGFQ